MLREAMQYIAGLKEESMDPKVIEDRKSVV